MADINDILKGKAAQKFLNKKKLRPWTVHGEDLSGSSSSDLSSTPLPNVEPDVATEVVATPPQVSAPAQSPNAVSGALNASQTSVDASPSVATRNIKIGQSPTTDKGTDTIPTQTKRATKPESRHSTDTNHKQTASPSSASTDTVPTQSKRATTPESRHSTDTNTAVVSINSHTSTDTVPTRKTSQAINRFEESAKSQESTDTESTQTRTSVRGQSRHNTDTNLNQKKINPQVSSDTIPTQTSENLESEYRHRADTNHKQNSRAAIPSADTIPTQIENSSPDQRSTDTVPTQYRHSTDKEPTPNPTQILVEYRHNTDTNFAHPEMLEARLHLLRGLQLKLIDYCCRCCISAGSETFRITYESLALNTGIPMGSVRTTAKRLRDYGLMQINAPIKGPGAFVEIILPEIIVKKMARALVQTPRSTDTVPTQNEQKYRHSTDTQTDTNASSSSSGNLNVLSTTTSGEFDSSFAVIDFSPLGDIGFSEAHLKQIALQRLLTPEQVQDAIHFFAFDLVENNKRQSIRGSPLNYFMGVLRKGIPYAPPDNYESAEERGLKAYMKRKREELEKQKSLEAELCTFECDSWLDSLTREQQIGLVPETEYARLGSPAHRALLKNHFNSEIWPERRQQINLTEN